MNARVRPRDIIPLPTRIGLSREEAAALVGVSPNMFVQMVGDGRMPRPRVVNSRRLWNAREVEAAFAALPREGEDSSPSTTWDDLA